jgi:RHS repeat-associated protein
MRYNLNIRGIYLPRFDSAVLEDVVTSVCNEDRYHYGFNGQMKDNEWAGLGNYLDFGDRIYDSRSGRFFSIDPFMSKFPSQSAYIFAGNNPIKFIDKNGEFKFDPDIKKNYPKVYKYLSTQLLKDVEKSADIYKVFQAQTNAKRIDIKKDFTNGSGVGLIPVSSPGEDDAGFTSDAPEFYSKSKDAIEINEKVLKYVEDKLANLNSTKLDKQQALLLLNMVLFHSEGHNLEFRFGLNDMVPDRYEIGYDIELGIYGIIREHTPENMEKPGKISGVNSKNDKLKPGVTEKIIQDANGNERKTSDLPTITN